MMGMAKHSQSSQNRRFLMSLQYSKKKFEMKLIFCMLINVKVSPTSWFKHWVSKFPARWYYYYWWTWLSILKVFKVTSLQYLYNISKKKSGMHILHAYKHQNFYTLALSFLIDEASYIQSTQNRNLVIF